MFFNTSKGTQTWALYSLRPHILFLRPTVIRIGQHVFINEDDLVVLGFFLVTVSLLEIQEIRNYLPVFYGGRL